MSTESQAAASAAGVREFDYVVVGGGSGGCAVAARLSEDPSVSVALIEAGPDDRGVDEVLQLNRWMELLESGYDWDYPIEPQDHGNSFMRHSRAKVLGGCSSHNSCIAFWPPAEDLDEWESRFGATGWNAEALWPVLKRMETNEDAGPDAPHHGDSGPVNLMNIPPVDPCGVALLEAAGQYGIPTVTFNAGTTVTRGANFFQINSRPDGVRSSSSVSYIHPIVDRENFTLLTGLRAKRLLFDGLRCVGVEVVDNQFGRTQVIRSARELVLSAGAIDSPKLLMLSGIGPAEHLAGLGVDVLMDSPGVGSNLQDHPEGVVSWEALAPMVETSTQWWEIGIFDTVDSGLDRPDLMMHYGSVPFDMHTLRQGYPTAENVFCLTPNVTHARSRGTVRLRSRDFRDKPLVDPRYFSDPEGYDLRIMTEGIRRAREIARQPAMAGWTGRELFPGPDADSDADLQAYIERTHNTVYHPVGSVAMGASDDAPVDAELRVKGVEGLRVADASIFPEHTSVNPNITVMMVGERCADLIRGR
ncbi:GMC family oxidoreductase [Gordonia shandongensis]|uniref:GMC family oxidoreductase n=1 Tax=Gordonia shandongensis TaxID=376351 RepID=UPI000419D01B|nr:GMC family oxidoreductase N-terminal domain-containing protein [Gordonia shandongensis]